METKDAIMYKDAVAQKFGKNWKLSDIRLTKEKPTFYWHQPDIMDGGYIVNATFGDDHVYCSLSQDGFAFAEKISEVTMPCKEGDVFTLDIKDDKLWITFNEKGL